MYQTCFAEDDVDGDFNGTLTRHAAERMAVRGLPQAAVVAALTYGRLVCVRGAEIHVIGNREVKRLRSEGLDLSRYEGVQVVCSQDGAIVTVYRSHDFRSLRPRRPRRRLQRRSRQA